MKNKAVKNDYIMCICNKCGNKWETPKWVYSHGLPKSMYIHAKKAEYDGCDKCSGGPVTFILTN